MACPSIDLVNQVHNKILCFSMASRSSPHQSFDPRLATFRSSHKATSTLVTTTHKLHSPRPDFDTLFLTRIRPNFGLLERFGRGFGVKIGSNSGQKIGSKRGSKLGWGVSRFRQPPKSSGKKDFFLRRIARIYVSFKNRDLTFMSARSAPTYRHIQNYYLSNSKTFKTVTVTVIWGKLIQMTFKTVIGSQWK